MLSGLCAIILRKALLVTSYSGVCKPQCYLFSILQLRIIIEGFVGKDILQAIAGKKIRLFVDVFKQQSGITHLESMAFSPQILC